MLNCLEKQNRTNNYNHFNTLEAELLYKLRKHTLKSDDNGGLPDDIIPECRTHQNIARCGLVKIEQRILIQP